MDNEMRELLVYRIKRAKELLEVAERLFEDGKYKDSNNRSYYAAYYAMKAIYVTKGQDFKRHKTLIANFNKEYVATEIFPRELGRKISTMSIIREQSDYNDFYIASKQESRQQWEIAKEIVENVEIYLKKQGLL